MSKTPKVSIVTITYNHEKYIREALDSFIAQKTDFNFEVIVADDSSTDKTPEIIREYARKHPDIFRPILRQKNIGAIANSLDALSSAKGTYIALCEGDDYWTDAQKIQKQADFLDNNQDCALCFHPVRVFFEDDKQVDFIYPEATKGKTFTLVELLNENFIQTNSVMYRRQQYKNIPIDVMPLDWYLHLYHASFGKIGFLPDVMSAYRRHPGGMWYGTNGDMSNIWSKYGTAHLALFAELIKLYGKNPEYKQIIFTQIINMFSRLINIDQERNQDKLVTEALLKRPETAEIFIKNLYLSIQNNEKTISEQTQEIEQKTQEIEQKTQEIEQALEENTNIKKSKSFRLGYYMLHPNELIKRVVSWLRSNARKKILRLHPRDYLGFWVAQRQYKKNNILIQDLRRNKDTQTAVMVHLYYKEAWPMFRQKLERLEGRPFDLFITVPKQNIDFIAQIKADFEKATIIQVPNWGRDVLPFMQLAPNLLRLGYSYVLKIHSKKSPHRLDGTDWLSEILNSLLPDDQSTVNRLFTTLEENETGVIGPANQYVSATVNFEPNGDHMTNILKRVYSKKTSYEVLQSQRANYGFFAGTMFWARLDSLKPIFDNQFSIINFESERGQIDGTFSHALERIFCLVPEVEGRAIYEIGISGIKQLPYKSENVPDWSKVYIGPKE